MNAKERWHAFGEILEECLENNINSPLKNINIISDLSLSLSTSL